MSSVCQTHREVRCRGRTNICNETIQRMKLWHIWHTSVLDNKKSVRLICQYVTQRYCVIWTLFCSCSALAHYWTNLKFLLVLIPPCRHPVRHHDPGAGRSDHHRVWEDGLQCSAGVQTEGTAVMWCQSLVDRVVSVEMFTDELLRVRFSRDFFSECLTPPPSPPFLSSSPPENTPSPNRLHHPIMN